jgi:hypothetical protein
MTHRHTADSITDDDLDQLYADLDRARAEANAWGEAESADVAAGSYAGRVEELQTVIDRVRALIDEHPVAVDTALLHEALDEQPAPAAAEATELRTALTEVLACLYAITRVGDPTPIGWQTLNPIRPAVYDRWQAALQPPTPAPPVPCPACTRAEQAGLAPDEQHPTCRTQEQR